MNSKFARSAAYSLVILLSLLALQRWSPLLPRHGAAGLLRDVVADARKKNPQTADLGYGQKDGYYGRLMRGTQDPNEIRTPIAKLIGRDVTGLTDVKQDAEFLMDEPKPNLRMVDQVEGPSTTNSYGMFDREYPLEKPAGTRRIALIGDSVSRGWGLPPDQRYKALFEAKLNQELQPQTGQRFEVLNFAVSGYRITQLYDVAVRKVPRFHPDVYLFAISELTVAPNWGRHLASLVKGQVDLRYDFLRDAAKKADLRPDDSYPATQYKLAPYRMQVIREVLVHLKQQAEQEHAKLVVLLVPAVEDPDDLQIRFRGIRELVERANIPVIDLTGTFADVPDLEAVRLAWYDTHPNRHGHQMIANDLFDKFREQPTAWAALTGQAVQYAKRH